MKTVGKQVALVVCIAAIAAGITWRIQPPVKVVPPITCDPATIGSDEICLNTVILDWKMDCIWIDARRRSDWQKDGIPGSILLTTAEGENFDQLLEQAFPTLAEKRKRVVVYCSDIGCGTSKEIAKRLREYQLVPEVRALHGGWKALSQAGLVKSQP